MKEAVDIGFVHRFEPGTDPAAPTLLLLHGTGGDENDLSPLGRTISPGSALLSPRQQDRLAGQARQNCGDEWLESNAPTAHPR